MLESEVEAEAESESESESLLKIRVVFLVGSMVTFLGIFTGVVGTLGRSNGRRGGFGGCCSFLRVSLSFVFC